MLTPEEIAALTDDEVATLAQALAMEQGMRATFNRIPAQIDELNRQYLGLAGVEPGATWVQPTGAHDAYPLGWTVVHGGKAWVSLMAGNAFEPGVSSWREVAEEGAYPEWVRPSGAQDAYTVGDRVTFEGQVFESVIQVNTWSPTEYPAGWTLVTE